MKPQPNESFDELSTTTFKLSPTDDPLGAEYWGAFKNVIALACGVSDGLKDGGFGGDNLKAAIFTAGYQEAVRLYPNSALHRRQPCPVLLSVTCM